MANTANSDKWYFTKEQLENTPSRKCGYDSYKELTYRQQAANFIQDMGQRLKVTLLCINTAIVYMHRFYVFHSFTQFPWHQMAAAALFLAAKVEEQPRKLEYVIRIANICRNPKDTAFDINSERYLNQSQDLVFNENVLLQTLGFDVAIDHPHTHVVRCCDLVRASKDLAQTSYFMATYSLHLTTMCIQYKPSVVACFCILVACKWSNWEIPLSNEKKEWYSYVDPTVTAELLQQLTEEFLQIFENSPSRLKEKINATANISHAPSSMNPALKMARDESIKDLHQHRANQESHKHSSRSSDPSSSQQQREREYREKKERERLAHQQQQKQMLSKSMPSSSSSSSSHSVHHRPQIDPKIQKSSSSSSSSSSHSRPPMGSNSSSSSSTGVSGSYAPSARVEPRDILREAVRDSPFGIASKEYNRTNEKDVQLKTPHTLLKPNVTSELVDTRYCDKQQRIDPNRANVRNSNSNNNNSSSSVSSLNKTKMVPNNKHDVVRRHDEHNIKSELDVKKHLSGSSSSSGYTNKSLNSTSLKPIKSTPPLTDIQQDVKSVPKLQQQQQPIITNHHNQLIGQQSNVMNKHHHNGGSYINLQQQQQQSQQQDVKPVVDVKLEPIVKEELVQIKRPSLFSPEKSPPQQKKPIQSSFKQEDGNESPRRRRHYSSSGSEPELRPVIKKIDQIEGFENLMRDTTIGINKFHQIPDIITPISDIPKLKIKEEFVTPSFSKEMKPPDIIPPLNVDNKTSSNSSSIVNGIETNPALISNLLKETPAVTHLTTANVTQNVEQQQQQQQETKEKDHHHHKSKKKNKEKHKHKDKDKSREDKDKKKKHKDKEREKNKHKEHKYEQQQPNVAEPIKIKIQKDKIQPPVPDNHNISTSSGGNGSAVGLKIKIPKERIKTESIGEPTGSNSSGGGSLKIKISKDVINNCNQQHGEHIANTSNNIPLNNTSRKRDRDRNSTTHNDVQQPPTKMQKSSYKESKQNGRHPYKVAQMGDGDTSLHRLAESKYITKGSSS